jgi:3-hydroxyisobutyrate dehydrogenase-like beta-hydroxyacid dehydrogenase
LAELIIFEQEKSEPMKITKVGILSPGDMGSAIGKVLSNSGFNVLTSLEGRSELTRIRAKESEMRDVHSVDNLVAESDLILSVLVPAQAMDIAQMVTGSVRFTGKHPAYADLNAIAPQTVKKIGAMMKDAGITFIDGGIIGSPPKAGRGGTRIYCSGPDTFALESLSQSGLDIRRLGPEIGQASGLKMVYAASTKGITALWMELLVAAEALGLEAALMEEFKLSGFNIAEVLKGRIPSMPRRARRWVGEMEEIAATFEGAGLTPRMLLGAADIYRLVSETQLADQTSREPDPTSEKVIQVLNSRLRGKKTSGSNNS